MSANKFDQMTVDIDELFMQPSEGRLNKEFPSFLQRIIKRLTIGSLLKTGLHRRLVDSGFIRGWFDEFELYWITVLDGRPLQLPDFFFLLGVYRQKFQACSVQQGAGSREFLAAWQDPKALYLLFGAVRTYAHQPFFGFRQEKWVKNNDKILEFGCGIAPATNFFLNYSTRRRLTFDIADIRQINSHYAKFRFGTAAHWIELETHNAVLPRKRYNVVFLIQVLEHLPDPVSAIRAICDSLVDDGVLIFDFILGDGDGLDTVEALQHRAEVIGLLKRKFVVEEGRLSEDESMGITVCRIAPTRGLDLLD